MLKRMRAFIRDDAGVAGVVTALALVVLAGFAALAVDVGYMYYKRSALQTSADAAALAGAGGLVAYGQDQVRVREVMLDYASRNLKAEDAPSVAARDGDVRFLSGGAPSAGDADEVEITVGRTSDRGNPLELMLGGILGKPVADVTATARAGVVGACNSKCLRPFAIPAVFTWDDYCDCSQCGIYYGNGVLDVESYCEVASVNVIGYSEQDLGAPVTLKLSADTDRIVPSHYNLVDYPPVNKGYPVTGASAVYANILGCEGGNSRAVVGEGDELLLEPGNKKGPVKSAIRQVIAEDPGAYWDAATGSVKGSVHADPMNSPRVAIIPAYDPRNPPVNGRSTIYVHQLIAVFIESVDGWGTVRGRFLRALARSPEPSDEDGCLLAMTRLLRDSSR